MALPSNLSYTLVKGRFIRSVLDSSDPDRFPDALPIPGLSFTFTPSLTDPRVKNVSSQPPTTIYLDTFTCTTNDNGDLVSPDGEVGVYVVSSDDPALNPSGWTYEVRISSAFAQDLVVNFIAPSNGVVDLTSLVSVPENGGEYQEEWAATALAAQLALNQVQDIRDILQGTSTRVAYLDDEGRISEGNLPYRLSDRALQDLIIDVASQSNFNLAVIDGGNSSSFQDTTVDGGTPSTTTFADTVDGGATNTTTFTSNIDGGLQ